MSKNDYSDARLVKNPWPAWAPVEGGGFARHWVFEFERPPPDDAVSPEGLGEPDLEVTLERGARPSELAVATTTRANAFSDEVFFAMAFRLFERLESKFGRVRTIQGQPRDQWRPFR